MEEKERIPTKQPKPKSEHGAGYDPDDGRTHVSRKNQAEKKRAKDKKPEEVKQEAKSLVEQLMRDEAPPAAPARVASSNKEAIEKSIEVLQVASEKNPTLANTLNIDSIQENSLAAEIASEILSADASLQDDPNFLIMKARDLLQGRGGMTREAYQEKTILLQAISNKVQEIAAQQGKAEQYQKILDKHILKDVPRAPREAAGGAGGRGKEPPHAGGTENGGGDDGNGEGSDKPEGDGEGLASRGFVLYDEVKELIEPGPGGAEKTENLRWLLRDFKQQIVVLDPESDAAATFLEGMLNRLREGKYDRLINKQHVWYEIDRVEAEPFIKRIQNQIKAEKGKVEKAKLEIIKLERNESKEARIKELTKNGDAIEWTADLKARYPQCDAEVGELISIRGLSKGALDMILSGPDGRWEWFSKFWQEIHTFSPERVHAEITDLYKWAAFREVIERVDPKATHVIAQFKEFWEMIGNIDAISKSWFQPGSFEDKVKSLKFMKPTDMQMLFRNVQWSEYTWSLNKTVALDKLQRRFVPFDELSEFINGTLSEEEWVKLEKGAKGIYNELKKEKKPTRDKLLVQLQKEYARRDESGDVVGYGTLPEELIDLKERLQQARDELGNGIFMRDYDVLYNGSAYRQLSDKLEEYKVVKNNLKNGYEEEGVGKATQKIKISENRRQELQARVRTLEDEMNETWKLFTDNSYANLDFSDFVQVEHTLNAVSGFSPTLIETRERLISYLQKKENIAPQELPAWVMKNEWKIRNAVLAAQYTTLAWGDMLEIAAHVSRAPMIDLDSAVLSVRGRDIMPAAFAEPMIRVLNPELFEDRFNMRGAFGQEIRENYYWVMMEKMAPDFMEHMPARAKAEFKKLRDKGKPTYKLLITEAAKYYGVPYTELIRPGFLSAGTHMSRSTWRPEISMLQPYREMMMEYREKHPGQGIIIDNQAVSLQFALENSMDETGVHNRIAFAEKQLQRTPSTFIELSGRDVYKLIKQEVPAIDLKSEEWHKFQSALSNAQIELWDDQEGLNVRAVNLASEEGFREVLQPHLTVAGIAPEQQLKYKIFLQKFQEYARVKDESGRNLLEKWARHTFPMTMPIIDFNIKNARPELLNAFSNERRINDQLGMSEVSNLTFQALEPKVMSPPNQDYTQHFEIMQKMREVYASYEHPANVEAMLAAQVDTFAWINMDRSMYNILGWIPGSKKIMRGIAEWDLRGTRDNKFLNWATNGKWKHMAEHKIEELPHSVAQAVSKSVKYLGGDALALNASELQSYFNQAEARGLFTEGRNIPKDLRKKYRTGLPWRYFYHTPRRFWWVVPVATIGLAVLQTTQEESKEKH